MPGTGQPSVNLRVMRKVVPVVGVSLGMLGLIAMLIFLLAPQTPPSAHWILWASGSVLLAMLVVCIGSLPALYREANGLGSVGAERWVSLACAGGGILLAIVGLLAAFVPLS